MYNTDKYVGECFDSILAQTFDDYEVIIVDDGSTDKSCEVVESYIQRFKGKLQLIRSKKIQVRAIQEISGYDIQ